MDFSTSMASSGLTAALIALIYAGIQVFKRSRCSSHNQCCDLDISRAETERQNTERHEKTAELVQLVLAQLRQQQEKSEEEEEEGQV